MTDPKTTPPTPQAPTFDPMSVPIQLPPMNVAVVQLLIEGLDQLQGARARPLANTIQELANRTIQQAQAEHAAATEPKPDPQPSAADVGAV